jgi:hypothetical protein
MGEDRVALGVIKIFDLIFLETPGGTQVEVSGVIIPKNTIFDLSTLSPISCLVRNLTT